MRRGGAAGECLGEPGRCDRWAERAAAFLALAFAAWLYGRRVMDPASVAWLLHGDPAQHYLGSVFFLSEPWHWPPGLITRFGEAPTSIVFTDALPLLALPAKLLGWPAGWQYFGLWMVACHVLSAVFAVRLLQSAGDAGNTAVAAPGLAPRLGLVAAALFFVFAPALLLRAYGHEALMGQFLVLASLYRALRPWRFGPWLLLAGVSVWVHPYLAVMTCVLGLGAAAAALWTRQLSWPSLAWQAGVAIFVLALLAWVAAYFTGAGQVSAAGHGFFSANALSWFDPMDWAAFTRTHQRAVSYDGEWSRLLPPLAQATGGQYEGFAFLGGGMLLVLAVAVVLAARSALDGGVWRPPQVALAASALAPVRTRALALWMTAVLLALWALSLRPSVGVHVLADLHAPGVVERFLGIFRASGRFIWPLTYLLMAWALGRVLRWRPRAWPAGVWVVVLALGLQGADTLDKLREFRARFRAGPPGVEPMSDLRAWQPMLARCPRLQILSATMPAPGWVGPALAAALSGAQVDPAPTARRSPEADQSRLDDVRQLLTTQGWRADTVYLLALPLPGVSVESILAALPPTHRARQLEGHTLVVPQACLDS